MKKLHTSLSLCVVFGIASVTFAQSAAKDIHDEIEQTTKAAQIFQAVMDAPDRGIPQRILDEADCIAVFPQVIKAAFGIGGRGGRGVVVCRTPKGWSAPAYLNLGGASFGLQIGVESTDYVMLFMTPDSARSLLGNNIKLGGNVSVAAGPIGREAGAATDLKLNAQILSYSRSKGLFAGAALEGAVIETANGDMRDVYGPDVTARAVLFEGTVKPPQEVTAFVKTIEAVTPGKK
ncbi:MAG TPA: lipid-binding SYLF domain-containing protein [Vicinamibacterales bacterium]|nr:lipid-binding SYLF domain-containing protein [Vicinamibacterales bacterium]